MKNENNKVNVTGIIVEPPILTDVIFGCEMYMTKIESDRSSGATDDVRVMIPGKLMNDKIREGVFVDITGTYRSFNRSVKHGKKVLYVFADEINIVEYAVYPANTIELTGYLCTEPFIKETHSGVSITNVMLAVNRAYGKSDYIPCIFWGKNAKRVFGLPVGSKIRVWGRIQSRDYFKKMGENKYEKLTTYEVSVHTVEVQDD